MTVFDSIRYPISTPPTEAELAALPEKLYNKWCDQRFTVLLEPERVARAYERVFESKLYDTPVINRSMESIKLLKKMIHEMDENEYI